jgi:uncharacterized membrane protein
MIRAFRLGGHPIHPAVVHFPIALWTVAVGADLAGWATGQSKWWSLGQLGLALGAAAGLLAMIAGAFDYAALPRTHPAQDTAVRHMLWMGTAWSLFVVSLAARGLPGSGPAPRWAIIAALAGFVVMVLGGWMGGQLVYRYGVGVTASNRDGIAGSDLPGNDQSGS